MHYHQRTPEPVIPHQLPPAPKLFTSRRRELAVLDGWLANDEAMVAVVSGPGGVGKTSLALRWLHTTRSRFPDGQLYVDLGAHSSEGPITPETALEWFLLALGVQAADIPPGLSRRQAMFRTVTAERSVSVLLDNAVSAAQVRPLLPTSPRSAVVVTSRWRLSGLAADGARFVDVESFDVESSLELLARAVGPRVASEPDAARELAELCGGLPIALSVVGARLSTRPRRTLSKEVGSLQSGRLAGLTLEDGISVEAVFDLSYVELPPRHARAYRLCALHPGASFGIDAAAAAVGEPVSEVEPVLAGLVEKNLLTEVGDERFRFHDLLRLHARQQAEWDSAAQRNAASRRVVEWYLDRLVGADLALRPTRHRVGPRFHGGVAPLESPRAALAWLDDERVNVREACRLAADQAWDDLTWQFCEAMWGYFLHTRHYDDWFALHELGVPAAVRTGNRAAEAKLRAQLAYTYSGLRQFSEAEREGLRALEIAEQDGDRQGMAVALTELGGVLQGVGELENALERLSRARAIRRDIGPRRAEALCGRRVGEVLAELGRDDEAGAELAAAAETMADLGDHVGQARCLVSVGVIHLRRKRPAQALSHLESALDVLRRVGSPFYEAETLALLGEAAEGIGDLPVARNHYAQALGLFAAAGNPKATTMKARLAALGEP
ncbi:tetratricopeptide repeat protein [Saccharothrix australiensis]|uniref:tetratricopeptide repeat protein n=1 Tax=Saccharothrix australiensis TaxID=2072 RepID=UPI0011C4A199|nr:tetratricopeptide repeat protein [Saccharothrix australiensis]